MTHSFGNKDLKGCWIEIFGENLLFGNNTADYLDAKGRFDLSTCILEGSPATIPKLVYCHSARDCMHSHLGGMREVLWAVWLGIPTTQVTIGCTKL
jgi:hypothetical protein